MNVWKEMGMYSFNSEKALLALVDESLINWIKSRAGKYDTFEDTVRDFETAIPNVTDTGYVLDALRSFVSVSHRSKYVREILDSALSSMVLMDNGVTRAVNGMYRRVFCDCFERNTAKYRLVWSEYRKTCWIAGNRDYV